MNTNGFNLAGALLAFPSLLATLFGGCLMAGSGGCALSKAMGTVSVLPQAMERLATGMSDMIANQGVMDDFIAGADGRFVEPGVTSEACVCTKVSTYLKGVAGSIAAELKGTGTQLPNDVKAAMIDQLKGPISDELRNRLLIALGWNRVESPHNPVPTP